MSASTKASVFLFTFLLTVGHEVFSEEIVRDGEGVETEDDASVGGDEVAVGIDGLSSMESWAPLDSVLFHASAACHVLNDDYYGVFAAFTLLDGTDELWFVVVDGLSTYARYGQVVRTEFVTAEQSIDTIDCASDGEWAYASWDRSNSSGALHGQWARAHPTLIDSLEGPYTIPDCGYNVPPYDPSPIGTSIAVHSGVVAVASGPAFYASCDICVDRYAPGGTHLGHYSDGVAGGTTFDTDIDWNGAGYFTIAVLYYHDDDYPEVRTTNMSPGGAFYSPCGAACVVYQGDVGDPIDGVDFVYSENSNNANHYGVARTYDATIWVSQFGAEVVDPDNPLMLGFWPDYSRATCEFWGTGLPPVPYRVAHTFSPRGYMTRHGHWSRWPDGLEQEIRDTSFMYWPSSCGSALTDSDSEVLLVSTRHPWSSSGRERLYVRMEPQW